LLCRQPHPALLAPCAENFFVGLFAAGAFQGLVYTERIDDFQGTIIERVGDSWSLNIHKKFTSNACWVKNSKDGDG
jgi:hypothetical protein